VTPANTVESSPLNDTNNGLESLQDGEKKKRYITTYERDPKLRRHAIEIHGTSCAACTFNFGETYGEYAEGFIHVHHTTPVSELDGPQTIDPQTDLVPLCANCHAVVHRRKDNTLTIGELRRLLDANKRAVQP